MNGLFAEFLYMLVGMLVVLLHVLLHMLSLLIGIGLAAYAESSGGNNHGAGLSSRELAAHKPRGNAR